MSLILKHPLANPRYTQQYAERPSTYGGRGHMGVDYGCPTGTPIMAVADGVVDVSENRAGGYGEYVILWHEELKFYSLYGHFSVRKVKVGDVVKQKDIIGLSGNTGNSTGPHLHYEIRTAIKRGTLDPVPGMNLAQVDPVSFTFGMLRGGPPEPPPPNGTIIVKTNASNVRSGPGTNNAVIGTAAAGTEGKAIARNAESTWVQVEINGLSGWMAEYLLDVVGGVAALPVAGAPPVEPPVDPPVDPPPVDPPAFEGVPVTVLTNSNVRSGPGTSFAKRSVATKGTTGKAMGRNEDATWIAVTLPTVEGWIAEYLLDVEGDHGALPVIKQEASGGTFERSMAFVLRWEGGWADNPADPGGATMKGITIGTYTRWRKAHGQDAPTKAELRAISDAEVYAIYKAWYWEESGADEMAWPMCLAHFDLAVNGGPGRAAQALAAVGPNFDAYMAWRIAWYKTLSGFPTFGKAWLNRCNDLIKEAAK